MTKTKRVLAFVLVLMLTVAIFALPAMAYSTSGCSCGRYTGRPNTSNPTWTTYDTTSCGHSPTGRHYFQRYTGQILCNCGRTFYGTATRTMCTVASVNRLQSSWVKKKLKEFSFSFFSTNSTKFNMPIPYMCAGCLLIIMLTPVSMLCYCFIRYVYTSFRVI